MSLQDWYYLFSIIIMALGIIILLVIGYVLITIKKNIDHLHKLIDEKVSQFNHFTSDPTDVALTLGAKVANVAVRKVKDAITNRK